MGGDRRGLRTTAAQMVLLCALAHQDAHDSLHAGTRRIEPLTARGADGPCRFWQRIGACWRIVFTEGGAA